MEQTSKDKKIVAYYIELFHTKLCKLSDENYILQSKTFKAIKEAEKFVKMISYIDGDLGIDLMVLIGTEEDYDIYKLGHYLENPEGLVLEITNLELMEDEDYFIDYLKEE